MNPIPLRRLFYAFLAGSLLAGLTPRIACAQGKAEPPAAGAEVRLDFDIDLGEKATVQSAVDVIVNGFRKAGQPVNVVVAAGAGSAAMPPLRLQRVTCEQAIQAVVIAANPSPRIDFLGQDMIVIKPGQTEGRPKMRAFNVSLFLRRPDERGGDDKQREEERRRYLERLNQLASAIQRGVSFSQKNNAGLKQPAIEFADESGLLFATGSPEALEIVAEVVHALNDPLNTPVPPARTLPNR